MNPADPTDPVDLLAPRPQRIQRRGGVLRLEGRSPLGVTLSGTRDERARTRLVQGLEALGVQALPGEGDGAADGARERAREGPVPGTWHLERTSGGGVRESYELEVSETGVTLRAPRDVGLFRGVSTLLQLARGAQPFAAGPRELPCLAIDDAPDLSRRGVLLDVSRDRVPTLSTLLELVERLADLKVNELQLHVEHAFAFEGHEQVWRGASPLTPADVVALDRHCLALHLELVPHLQSFGHMHRWLVHDRYRPLAECPEGVRHPFSLEPEPFSLCPTDPRALELVAGLYDLFLPHFSSDRFHLGCDETFDLGRGRSRAACQARGRGRVYLEFVQGLCALARDRGRRPMVWGDGLVAHPELAGELPADVTPVVWGYEADHPFDRELAPFAEGGRPFQVAAGTSSWQSLVGRTANMRGNLAAAAAAAVRHGAEGLLVCDWGDWGHWQPPSVAWPGLVVGAARAWNGADGVEALAEVLDAHLFGDPAGITGRTLLELGELASESGCHTPHGTPWFFALRHAGAPWPPESGEGPGARDLERVEARAAELQGTLARHGMTGAAGELVERELRWAAQVTRFGCRLGRARLGVGAGRPLAGLSNHIRSDLAAQLLPLVQEHRSLWPRRSRPGGLADSLARFEHVLLQLVGARGGGS